MPSIAMDNDGLAARLAEVGRFELTHVPRHLRERLNTLARLWGVSQSEAFAICIQTAEAILPNLQATMYHDWLQRRLCAPEGTTSRMKIAPVKLPDIPDLYPPLGITFDKAEILDAAMAARVARMMPSHPANREREAAPAALPARRLSVPDKPGGDGAA